MIRVTRHTCLIALPLALAACGGKEPDASATAAGEILEGSVSDSMLPLDTVRSQPPLAPRTETAKANGRKGEPEAEAETEDEAADSAAMPTDAAATPAAAPTISVPPAPTSPPSPRPTMR